KQRDDLWKTFSLQRLDGAGKTISADVGRHLLPQFFVANEERFDHSLGSHTRAVRHHRQLSTPQEWRTAKCESGFARVGVNMVLGVDGHFYLAFTAPTIACPPS